MKTTPIDIIDKIPAGGQESVPAAKLQAYRNAATALKKVKQKHFVVRKVNKEHVIVRIL
jgi:hypothetical protein